MQDSPPLFHVLRTLLDHTNVYSPQLSPSHSQSNYTHKSAFLDGVIAVNVYTLKILHRILKIPFLYIYLYKYTHAGEVTMQSTNAHELMGSYYMDRPFLNSCPVW